MCCTFFNLCLFLYYQHTLRLQKMVNTFIWNNKKARVAKDSISHAVLGAPDLSKYYKASILEQTKFWWSPTSDKRWIQIEQQAITYDLQAVLGASSLTHKTHKSFLDTANATLRTWVSTLKLAGYDLKIIDSNTPLSALSIVIPDLEMSSWRSRDLNLVAKLFDPHQMRAFEELLVSLTKTSINIYKSDTSCPSWKEGRLYC